MVWSRLKLSSAQDEAIWAAFLQLSDTQMLMSQAPCYHNTHTLNRFPPRTQIHTRSIPACSHSYLQVCMYTHSLTHNYAVYVYVCCNGTTSAVRLILPCPCFCFTLFFPPIFSSPLTFCSLFVSFVCFFSPLFISSLLFCSPPVPFSCLLFLLSQSFSLHCSL